MNSAVPNSPLAEAQETVRLLQEELARTNQEVLLLTLELESRVENRTAQLRAAREQLEQTNLDLRELTLKLEERVVERTRALKQLNESLLEEIEDRKRAEAKLKAANEALRQANSDLEQFAYSASHDLQEPLRMVGMYCQMLKKRYAGKLDVHADGYINYAVQGATRMERLIADLLTYISLMSTPEGAPTVADANEVLLCAISNLRAAIEQSGAVITNTILPRVRMQPVHLLQVFQNLLGNAIKYRNKESPNIAISAIWRESKWLFSVQDNGIGIDERYTANIFGIFKRLHSADEYSGTGIGLAICKRIIEAYGGRIWVESQLGNGSTFLFTVYDGG
jgi:light-regulated signal transduction histidine kinase (bacteriophytochrome)